MEDVIEKYKRAGNILVAVEEETRKILKPGMSLREIAESIESSICKKGGEPAFPVNISVNDIAAHYTPTYNDTKVIEKSELVKIDIGVHVDGYIADRAFTYCSEKSELVRCVEEALDNALRIISPGLPVHEIGKTIHETAESHGLGLIVNLTGHGLDKYVFHGSPSIPNIRNNVSHDLKEGEVIAIEPFVAPKNGHVREAGQAEIFHFIQNRPVRLIEARDILKMGSTDYHELPFAKRWLCKRISPIKVSLALRQLEAVNALESFPPLREVSGMAIAQAEHTVIVREKPVVTTRKI
jgi:methionyl aminopeptidase